ncbi:D-amino acid dehydrogenase, partial [Burkholderia sp. AW33-5]
LISGKKPAIQADDLSVHRYPKDVAGQMRRAYA